MTDKNIYRERGRFPVRTALVLLIAAAIIASGILISYKLTGVRNPIAYGVGVFNVTVANHKTEVVQVSPRVVLARTGNAEQTFRETMEFEGYYIIEDECSDGLFTVERDGEKSVVKLSQRNGYCIWAWQ